MACIERSEGPREVRGVERSLEIRLGEVGGFELRPTRLFLWSGAEREGGERILSFGRAPRSLDIPRQERELRAGGLALRALGNPLLTIALAGVHAVRKLAEENAAS